MAAAAEVRSSQAGSLVLAEAVSPEVRAIQAATMVLGIYPTEELRASQAGALVLVDSHSKEVRASQAATMVLARGRVSDPNVRAWTFTLDGHDFYVINVGDLETLVYDATIGDWVTWGNNNDSVFYAKTGINWIGAKGFADEYGSNILVGHDTAGTLMILDPDFQADESPIPDDDRKFDFRRQVTTQTVISPGYSRIPCFGLQAYGSIGDNDADVSDLTVTLEYSDDRGNTYFNAGTLAVPNDDYDFRLNWRSLGSMQAPGRLFRITDYGAMKRLDGLEMEDNTDG